MATSFDSVIDMALIIIRDYKLDALYQEDAESFKLVLQGYMLKGLPKFIPSCVDSLSYNFVVSKKSVSLNAPINKIGNYTMLIKLTSKVKCELAISVTASEVVKESIEEEVTEEAAE